MRCSDWPLGEQHALWGRGLGPHFPSGLGLPPRPCPAGAECPSTREFPPHPASPAMGSTGSAGSSALAHLRLPEQPRPWFSVAALALAAVALGAVAWRRARPRRRRPLQQVGTVAQLWIYPIKSCRGMSVSEAECTAMGLRCGDLRDRFWLVINENGNMVTARQEPRLVLISLTCDRATLTLHADCMEDLLLPIKIPTTNAEHKCRRFWGMPHIQTTTAAFPSASSAACRSTHL